MKSTTLKTKILKNCPSLQYMLSLLISIGSLLSEQDVLDLPIQLQCAPIDCSKCLPIVFGSNEDNLASEESRSEWFLPELQRGGLTSTCRRQAVHRTQPEEATKRENGWRVLNWITRTVVATNFFKGIYFQQGIFLQQEITRLTIIQGICPFKTPFSLIRAKACYHSFWD